MPKRYKGRHRRATRHLTVASLARPAAVISTAAAVSLGVIAPAQAHTGQHTVRPGDTLSQLAASHSTTWRTVYGANRGTIGGDPNMLRVGQRLSIGGSGSTSRGSTSASSSPSPSGRYVVRQGDTLGAIAARHGTTWQRLYSANRTVIGANPNLLRIGQRLLISGVAAGPVSEPTPQRASRTYERPDRVAGAYSAWDAHVRPAVHEVAQRFNVGTVLTRPGHSPTQGRAADFMVYTDRAKGDAVARYVIDNAARLGVQYVIWRQRIYLVASGSWRPMADRGSATANHMDHPHVAFRSAR
jgi:LysM repeat protein